MISILKFIDQIGFSVCHQLPQRTLLFGNLLMPVCSRCSGIYIGFLFTMVFLFILFRKRESELPPVYVIVIAIVFILSSIIDGLLSYLGVYITNNILRLITGYMFGAGISIIIYPVFVYQYFKDTQKKKIFQNYRQFIYFIIISVILSLVQILGPYWFGTFFYYLNGFSVIFTFYFSNLTLLLLIPYFSQKAARLFSRHFIFPSVIALAASFLELFLSYRLHIFLSR
ncbi:MAG: DUF2085 domain-containing protein [Candidatus Humimicrobiaceae bacterium]